LWPHLVQRVDDQGQLLGYVVQGQSNAQLWFDMDNGQLAARFGSKSAVGGLSFDRESWTFVLTDPSGNVTNFAAFDQRTCALGRRCKQATWGQGDPPEADVRQLRQGTRQEKRDR